MIYKCFMQCDGVCLNNPNHAFQSYIHAIINDIMTSDMLCQSDNTLVLVKIYTWLLINDLLTTCDMLCQPSSNFVLVKNSAHVSIFMLLLL